MKNSHSSTGLVPCENTDLWDDFCDASPEGTPFMQTWFVKATSNAADRYYWQENGKPLAAILVPLENGVPTRPEFSVYHSVCFAAELAKLSDAKRNRKCFDVLDSIVKEITKKYQQVFFLLHPNIIDIRPLLWHNYHCPELGVFNVDVRYTAVRSLVNINSAEELMSDIRKDRRADYKKSVIEKLKISFQPDIEQFIKLYQMTFDRQNIQIDLGSLSTLEKILSGITKNRGFMLFALTADNIPVSAVAILIGRRCAYGLFTANHPDYRHLGGNTALVLEAMLYAKSLGLSSFDFIGANSPFRGDYKLSFNSELKSYFECIKSA